MAKYFTKALRCPDGSRKYIRGKTREELERKVRQAQVELGMGVNINDNTTVVEFAQMWIDTYKRPKIKPQSVDAVLTIMNLHILPVIGGMKVREVRPADCARVMMNANGKARNTQKAIRVRLKELFTCAVENGIIARNPVTSSVSAGGSPAREREPLSQDQLNLLLEKIMARKDYELYTFVLLCGYAGLREAEAVGLNLRNVDFDQGTISVTEQYATRRNRTSPTENLKTTSSLRTVPAPPALLARLMSVKRERGSNAYVFDVQDPNLMKKIVPRLSRMCEVDSNNRPVSRRYPHTVPFYVHPHLLRHTYATLCFEAGLDIKEVQYLLGHSSTNMTLNVYLHYSKNTRSSATASKVNAIFSGNVLVV